MGLSRNWLAYWIEDPDSNGIAAELNAQVPRPAGCRHDRSPCYLRCGVQLEWVFVDGKFPERRWVTIAKKHRLEWKRDMLRGEPEEL